jgi:hypothetical protein
MNKKLPNNNGSVACGLSMAARQVYNWIQLEGRSHRARLPCLIPSLYVPLKMLAKVAEETFLGKQSLVSVLHVIQLIVQLVMIRREKR